MSKPMFIFGGDTGVKTPEDLKRLRAIANALGGPSRAPQNVGEGLNAIGEALGYRIAAGRAARGEAYAREQEAAAMNPILGALGWAPPAGQSAVLNALNPKANDSDPATARVSQAHGDPTIRQGIIDTAESLGIDPVDLATTISYETAGTFDPTKAGPTTQWGQHRGLIQFGEPQAEEHGVNWNDPVASQLGPNGAVASYLRKAGVQPGMGLLDIYSAVNAGAPGLYDRSDANNGGAPGTVRDKVEQQMAGHRQKALGLIGEYQPGGAAAALDQMAQAWPQKQAAMLETAPSDPASWPARQAELARQNSPQWLNDLVDEQGTSRQPASAYAGPGPTSLSRAPINPQMPMAGGQGFGPVSGQMATAQQPVQVARAQGGPTLPQLYQALQSPWLGEQNRAIIVDEINRQRTEADPMTQMARERARLELDRLRNPQTADWSRLDDGRLFNQRTGEVRDVGGAAAGPSDLGLNPQYGLDAEGNPVLLQLGKDGRVVQSQMPEGVTLSKEPIRLDAGTHFVLLDPITRQPIGQIPKNLAGAEREKAVGKAGGEAYAAAPSDLQSSQNALDLIASIRNDPNRERGTGFSSNFNWIPGTGGFDFQRKVNQATSGAFLSAIQQLRGMGALSNAEGQTATQAVTRLDTASSEEEFLNALADYERIVVQGRDKAAARLAAGPGGNPEVPTQLPPITVPAGVDPEDWAVMTDEEKALFQ